MSGVRSQVSGVRSQRYGVTFHFLVCTHISRHTLNVTMTLRRTEALLVVDVEGVDGGQ